MSERLKIRLAARCEAAGRPNNEDNFQVDADLSVGNWQFNGDEVLSLGDKGALLLVCDGMGGMNAGEVASKIAVDTVKQRFSIDCLTKAVLDSDERRCNYIKQVIQESDANIKKESRADEAKSGMGSTIVLAWIFDSKVYVGWCGDSRAYKYNPQKGFVQLSHDHSYVQELVDSGKLSPELAFDHPNNNIITRSLGDPRGTAQPDVKWYPLEENDVILLCSDGLCGVLRDNEMERIIASQLNSMVSCRDALWEAARSAGWHDNVTIALAQIMPTQAQPLISKPVENKQDELKTTNPKPIKKTKIWEKKYFKICCAIVAVLLLALILLLKNPFVGNQGLNPDVCEQYSDLVNNYCKIQRPGDTEAFKIIQNVCDSIDYIKGCENLKPNVLEATDNQLNKLDPSMDGMAEVSEMLNTIKNNLK